MQYVFPTYNRFPLDIVAGEDWHLTDDNNKTYLDFTSGIGVCNFGYSNELIQKSVAQQLTKIWHTSNLYESHLQDEVAHQLVGTEDRLVFFCNSGTEANEAALKLARKFTGKSAVLSFNNSFHGRTYGSMSLTGNPAIQTGFAPLVPGISFADYNDPAAIEQIKPDLAAVILEVIQGEGGVYAAKAQWLKAVAKACHEQQVLLIIDEVQTGIGRTGKRFAYQYYELDPDIVTVAKGLGNGLPIGAMIGKSNLAVAFGPGSHGTTFGGNKIALAAATAVLQQLTPEFLAGVQTKATQVWQTLQNEILTLPVVTSVTGLGLMIGIHLDETVAVADVIEELQQNGLLTLSAKHNTLRLLPPLVMDSTDLMFGLQKIKQVLSSKTQK
ncbi:acetylornithine transaminase [Loigolactobacillus backii]|uniref:Acetylornithine aminotransferase n=1 Tax=Loigolactobacillus backii TaxID=375175 RepID=A0A192H0F7_9LACO|nr:acetylornithine transaminase [Loigolactobacillus backii]ANK60285.1 acetylornithine aminotransferase [Loigolactobacillus backii]ANK62274.1 acetylornithine aminotransferase [Loigolactobacillus backii]ANK65167.1 acetylornithine aminotransferase [Loigolactobacillus backii]ANK67726.1 acetylornithine aminotransferase [Loigolactobacillus backii]ANK70713.1 acetylornithine aminotransferase [Loigolactobacillus backii]